MKRMERTRRNDLRFGTVNEEQASVISNNEPTARLPDCIMITQFPRNIMRWNPIEVPLFKSDCV